jgi:hypothetical protein
MSTIKCFVIGAVLIGVGLLTRGLPAKVALYWPWPIVIGVAAAIFGLLVVPKNKSLPRVAITGVGLTGLGVWFAVWVPEDTPGRDYWPWAVVAGLPLLAGAMFVWLRGRGGSAGLVNRWSRRARRERVRFTPELRLERLDQPLGVLGDRPASRAEQLHHFRGDPDDLAGLAVRARGEPHPQRAGQVLR